MLIELPIVFHSQGVPLVGRFFRNTASWEERQPAIIDVLNALRDELQDFDVSGRTIRFSAKRPLPAALVKRIVKARVQENEARVKPQGSRGRCT